MYDTKIEKVQVEKLDLDFERYLDFATGRGIRIDSAEAYDAKKRKIWNGLQSEFWGTDFGDEYAFQERYRCKCGKYMSKHWNGFVCDACGTTVEYREPDVTRTGWIMLDYNRKVISPIFSMKLSAALGKVEGHTVLSRILRSPYRIQGETEITEKEAKELKAHPFLGKGMTWLVDHLDEVLDWYQKKKPNNAPKFDEIRRDRDIVFTSGIPVFSSIMRIELPGNKNEKLFKMKVNTLFQSIIMSTNKVNSYSLEDAESDKVQAQIDKLLASTQNEIEELFDAIFAVLDGKYGVIQAKVLGGRYDWCSRDIITPNSGELRSDEIDIPYIAGMELFRYEICNKYSKLMGTTMAKTNQIWEQSKNYFNPTMWMIMNEIVTKGRAYINILFNRNPSINYGSFMAMKIRSVKKNFHDKACTIPTSIIQIMNADFDGDQINIFRIFGLDLGKDFIKCMSPRFNHFISRMDGRCNRDILPIKDEIAAFWALNNI